MRGGGVRAALLFFIGVWRTNELALERRSASNIADQSVRSHAHAKKFVISSKISANYVSAPRSLHPEALSQPSIVVYVVAFLARLI